MLFPLAGWLLALTALLNFLHVLEPRLPLWLAGACAWSALGLMLVISPKVQFKQFFALSSVGLLCLLWAIMRGGDWSITSLLAQNNAVVVMLFSVSFLRLVAVPSDERQPLPQGKQAFLTTFLGIQGLGAVINLSILTLVGERFKHKQVLSRESLTLMGRSFSMAAYWSPFFAAMGVALTYAPGANLIQLMLYGALVSCIALVLSIIELTGWRMQKADQFYGYPMQLRSLFIPLSLAVSVLVLHYVFPDVAVLALVSVMSIVMTVLILLLRYKAKALQPLTQHLNTIGTRMTREIALFLGAAVMTIGIQALLSTYPSMQLFQQFGAFEASLLLAVAIALAMVGVHPVVSIALIGSMMMPLQPPLEVLALLFLSIWSIGVVASPLSGMNAMIRSQFDAKGRDLFYWHIRYVVMMWLVLSCVFWAIL